jgi:hypothetical protein
VAGGVRGVGDGDRVTLDGEPGLLQLGGMPSLDRLDEAPDSRSGSPSPWDRLKVPQSVTAAEVALGRMFEPSLSASGPAHAASANGISATPRRPGLTTPPSSVTRPFVSTQRRSDAFLGCPNGWRSDDRILACGPAGDRRSVRSL